MIQQPYNNPVQQGVQNNPNFAQPQQNNNQPTSNVIPENQKLQYTTLTYIGKDFVRKFDNPDGTTTISSKFKFKQNLDQQYTINFWGYSSTKGVEILVEGEQFVIGYIEKPNTKGDKPLKIAKFFGVNDNTTTTQQKAIPVNGTQPYDANAPVAQSNTQHQMQLADVPLPDQKPVLTQPEQSFLNLIKQNPQITDQCKIDEEYFGKILVATFQKQNLAIPDLGRVKLLRGLI